MIYSLLKEIWNKTMKQLFSIDDLKDFYRKEVEHGIFSGGFERWLNTSNYSLVGDGMYEYTYQRDYRDKVLKEIKNCMSIAELS